jgi:hypothetical protein
MADQAPLSRTQNHQVPAVGTAGNDATTVLFQAPFACTVTLVNYVPAAAITGANTNTRLVELVNKGQAGSVHGAGRVAAVQLRCERGGGRREGGHPVGDGREPRPRGRGHGDLELDARRDRDHRPGRPGLGRLSTRNDG